MPQRRQPECLERLALKGVGEWVKVVGRDVARPVYVATQHDPSQGLLLLHSLMELIRNTLYSSTPRYLFDDMARQVLTAVEELINETKCGYDSYQPMNVFLNKMKVAVSLSAVVMHSQLKSLEVCRWPKIMRHELNQNLHRLEGVECLNLGSGTSGWEMTETEKNILSGVCLMSNLTTFYLCIDCTNNILMALGNYCPALQYVDITSSRSVTDRGVPSLLNCKRLKEVKLFQTQVTVAGYKDLVSGLPDLQDIGRCDDFGRVLQKLHEDKCGPLSLQALQCRDMTFKQLQLLAIFCPKLSSVSIFHDERVADLTVLSLLENLRDLKILNCDFYTDRIKDLLEKVGMNLTTIHFEHVDEIDLNGLRYISQLCPNLRKLSFINCEFSDHYSMSYNSPKCHITPFADLQRLICVSDCSLEQLEFLLMHCHNIKFIQLGSSTGINDSTIRRVLERNPMSKLEELRILYGEDLSMQSVKLLMDCERLHTLSELENWEAISAEQLSAFKQYLRENNLKLDVRPTLSYSS